MMVRIRLGYCLVAAKQLCHIQSSFWYNGSDKWGTYSIVARKLFDILIVFLKVFSEEDGRKKLADDKTRAKLPSM